MYGDIVLTLAKTQTNKFTGQIKTIDTTTFQIDRVVFITKNGDVLTDRLIDKLKLPHHLLNHDITSITMIGGVELGQTMYDV